jgi:hypothetical protein
MSYTSVVLMQRCCNKLVVNTTRLTIQSINHPKAQDHDASSQSTATSSSSRIELQRYSSIHRSTSSTRSPLSSIATCDLELYAYIRLERGCSFQTDVAIELRCGL